MAGKSPRAAGNFYPRWTRLFRWLPSLRGPSKLTSRKSRPHVQSHHFDSSLVTNIRSLMAGKQILHDDPPNAHRAHDIRRDDGGCPCRLNCFCKLLEKPAWLWEL